MKSIPLFAGDEIVGFLAKDSERDADRAPFEILAIERKPAPPGHGPPGSTIVEAYKIVVAWDIIVSDRDPLGQDGGLGRHHAMVLRLHNPDDRRHLGGVKNFKWFAEIFGCKVDPITGRSK